MVRTRQQCQGGWAEQRALRLLRGRGWCLLSRNWRCRWGELDLVLAKPGRLLIVEVKGRRGGGPDRYGIAALDERKRQRLGAAMGCWLVEHPSWAETGWELVAALVPLPPAVGPVRWIRWGGG